MPDSPLSHDEAAAIDALPWPLLERQRLRLLAHSLRSLQAAARRSDGDLPSSRELESWAMAQLSSSLLLGRSPSLRLAAACRLRRLWASSRRRWRSSSGQGRASMAAASSWLSGLSGTGGEPEATGVIAVELPVHPLNAAIREGSPHHLQLLITDQWESLRHP